MTDQTSRDVAKGDATVAKSQARANVPAKGARKSAKHVKKIPKAQSAQRTPAQHPVMEMASPADEDQGSPHTLDRATRAWLGRFTGSVSPAAFMGAYADWWMHMAISPGKQLELVDKAVRKMARFAAYNTHLLSGRECDACIEPLPQDKRFAHEDWQTWPYNVMYQGFLLTQQWWHNATTDVRGVSRHHEDVVSFMTRQILDIFSPSNFPLTNPEIIRVTAEKGGMNPVSRLDELPGRHGAAACRAPPCRHREVQGWRDCRDHAGQGRLSEQPDRADPVQPHDRAGLCRADPDRARMDHEVLHSGPVAAQFTGQVSG